MASIPVGVAPHILQDFDGAKPMASEPDTLTDPRETHRFPCDTCGSDLRFDPGGERLVCDHCGNVEPIEHGPWSRAAAIKELDYQAALTAGLANADVAETRASTTRRTSWWTSRRILRPGVMNRARRT